MNRYIITGGPGAGKTSLLKALKNLNFHCSEEASRQLIIEEAAKQSECLPWLDLASFAEKVLERMILLHQESSDIEPTFFDRGIPDIMAYLKAAGLPVPEKYNEALKKNKYHNTVFILPPWESIYVNDSERWQTFEEAERLYQSLKETYKSLGFQLIELPKSDIKERVQIVLDTVNLSAPRIIER